MSIRQSRFIFGWISLTFDVLEKRLPCAWDLHQGRQTPDRRCGKDHTGTLWVVASCIVYLKGVSVEKHEIG